MKRTNVKKALVVLAVASLAAGMSSNAFAGTDACIEFYKGILPTENILGVPYAGSACVPARGTTDALSSATGLVVPYELTGVKKFDLSNYDGSQSALTTVYIPTSAIPPGSYIEMTLSTPSTGTATWTSDNANLWLVASDGTSFSNAASSIGSTNSNVVTFLTGSTIIPGGTRLAISTLGTSIVPPTILFTNSGCTPPTNGLALSVTKAQTAQLVSIPGAATQPFISYKLVDNTLRQFNFYLAPVNAATTAQVDVTPGVDKKSFVDATTPTNATLDTTATQVFYTATVENKALNDSPFDLTIANTDARALFTFTSINGSGSAKSISSGMSVIVADVANKINDTVTPVTGGVAAFGGPNYNTATATVTGDLIFKIADANETNTTAGNKNDIFYALTTNGTTPMLSNYFVNAELDLKFPAHDLPATFDQYIQSCTATTSAFNIGVNGTIFRVPYLYHENTVSSASSFVRISNNEDLNNDAAAISADFFVEGAGFQCDGVQLGTVNAKSSTVVSDAQMLTAIRAKGTAECTGLATNLATQSGRFSAIFTVSAPKESVHAVAVQKNVGGSGTGDRVVPVLFETATSSTWQQ